MSPPFEITAVILDKVSRIERLIGRIESLNQPKPQPYLRKQNRVKTVQGSLAIEGNTLNLDQVTALIEGKTVIGDKSEVQEIVNAIEAYDRMPSFKPLSHKSLLEAHGLMMEKLIPSAGKWRSGNVGILKGTNVSHLAPPADRVHYLMSELFDFLKADKQHPLIAGCVFHYELEFIHPFEDGNGRVGRFWHSLLLYRYHPVFEFIPVESLIKDEQKAYYEALESSDRAGQSTVFIEFSLSLIHQALAEFLDALKPASLTTDSRLEIAASVFEGNPFSRKDYLNHFKLISTATASRDLKAGLEKGLLEKEGERALTVYRYQNSEKDK